LVFAVLGGAEDQEGVAGLDGPEDGRVNVAAARHVDDAQLDPARRQGALQLLRHGHISCSTPNRIEPKMRSAAV